MVSKLDDKLTGRQIKILIEITSGYIFDGNPVGSRKVSKIDGMNVSPATIRNDMAELEEMGYLSHPHTSAGRIPSDKGFRFFVNHLTSNRNFLGEEKTKIKARRNSLFEIKQDQESLFHKVSELLSNVTSYIGMVQLSAPRKIRLKNLQLIKVNDCQILAILITETDVVLQRVIPVNHSASQDNLHQISSLLNMYIRGCSIEEIQGKLSQYVEMERIRYQKVGEILIRSVEIIDQFSYTSSQIYINEKSRIFDIPEFQDLGMLKEMYCFLENGEELFKHLRSVTAPISIMFGNEIECFPIDDIAMIVAPYHCCDKVVGTVGVIGPKRMRYDQTIPVVETTAGILSDVLSET